jgi:hypothetical protein
LEGAGWSPGFALKRKPIFGGQFKGGKFWAPKHKTRSKSHFKPKSNLGLDLEGKPTGHVYPSGDISIPILSDDPPKKMPMVSLAMAIASGIV